MTRYYCNRCKKSISKGVLIYSMDHFNRPLCRYCQEKVSLSNDIRDGKVKIEKKKFLKCTRCGKEFSYAQDEPFCSECSKEIKNIKAHNPFSLNYYDRSAHDSHLLDSDHHD